MRVKILILSICLFLNYKIFNLIGTISNSFIYCTFFFNATFSLFFFIYDGLKKNLNLRLVFFFYSYLFLAIVPYLQFAESVWMSSQSISQIINTNLIIIIYNLTFMIGYSIPKYISNRSVSRNLNTFFYVKKSSFTLTIYFLLLLHILFTLLGGFNLTQSIFFDLFGGYNPISLVIDIVFKSLILYLFIFYLISKERKSAISFIILVYLFLYYNNPIASSRFYAFMAYLLILVLFFKRISKIKFFYNFVLISGILGSFYQNAFRAAFSPSVGGSEGTSSFEIGYFFQGHFDSYENISNTITFVQDFGIIWGKQLIGVFLFWIPRSIWINKPEGSGTFLGKNFYSFDTTNQNLNISAPLLMEEYLNFGILGVILGTFFLGYLVSFLDFKFSFSEYSIDDLPKNMLSSKLIGFIFYVSFLGLFLFILRGDLLSSLSYTLGIFLSYRITRKLVLFKY
jgi:hypothetical protein